MNLNEARIGMRVRYLGKDEGGLLKPGSIVTVGGIYADNIYVVEVSGTGWTMRPEDFDIEDAIYEKISIDDLSNLARQGWSAEDVIRFKQEGVL